MSTKTNHSEFDRELLSAYVDGELTQAERTTVETQLASDSAAQREVEEFRRLSGMIQALPRPALPADISAQVLERAKAARLAAEVEPVRPEITIGRSWHGWLWAGAALAAGLLIMAFLPNEPREIAKRTTTASAPADTREEVPEMRAARNAEPPLAVMSESEQLAGGPLSEAERAESLKRENSSRFSVPDKSLAQNAPPAQEEEKMAFGKPSIEEPEFLIVRLSMPAEALEGRQLDQVLSKHGIEVESAEELTESRRGEVAAARSRAMQEESLAGEELDSSRDRAGGENKIELELAREEPVEFVFVEAPPEQIAASLAEIQRDAANFQVVKIERDSPTQWRQYNRGGLVDGFGRKVPSTAGGFGGLSQEADSPAERIPPYSGDVASSLPKASDSESEERELPPSEAAVPPPAAPAPAPLPAVIAPNDPEPQQLGKKQSESGKAYRYLARDPDTYAVDEIERRRAQLKSRQSVELQVQSGQRGGKPPVQVLFVVEGTAPLLAAPAVEEPPSPAAPAESPQ